METPEDKILDILMEAVLSRLSAKNASEEEVVSAFYDMALFMIKNCPHFFDRINDEDCKYEDVTEDMLYQRYLEAFGKK